MRIYLPEISWHDREPIYSCSFNPSDLSKFATAGVSKQIRIWRINSPEGDLQPSIDFISEISWHTRTVNVVRFNNTSGELLASGGDDAVICISQLAINSPTKRGKEDFLENWKLCKTLRGHLEDVLDIAWSADDQWLLSASVDNAFIVWDVHKGTKQFLVNEGQGLVQGICVDCNLDYIGTLSSDRVLRIYEGKTSKKICKVTKLSPGYLLTSATSQTDIPGKGSRLFYDKEYGAFMRRLNFTIDGQFLISTGAQMVQPHSSHKMAAVVFHRSNLKTPVAFLCANQESTIAVAMYPYKLVHKHLPGTGFASKFSLPYRLVIAILTEQSILLYDSEQDTPFGRVSDIHYASLTDICWSKDGRYLIVVSIDGYVTFVLINPNEFGARYEEAISGNRLNPDISTQKLFKFQQFGVDLRNTNQLPQYEHNKTENTDDISAALSHQMEESMDFSNA